MKWEIQIIEKMLLSIPTCSNAGATDALDTASQPNEAPDTAHEYLQLMK